MGPDRAPYSGFVGNNLFTDLGIGNYANLLFSVLKDVWSQLLITYEEKK